MAIWLIAVVGAAPCQCFSASGIQTTSPGRLAYGSSPAALAVDQSLRALAVPGSLDRNLRCGALDVAEIARRKFHFSGPDILLDARQLRGTWDGNHPRLLTKHPGERDLGRCRLLALSDCIEQLDQASIRLPGLLRKTRYGVIRKSVLSKLVFSSIFPVR